MRGLEPSLSIVLPVQNAEAAFARQLNELLEFAADLTERFEILIIDETSTDETVDIALEFSARYPQVHFLGCMAGQERDAVIERGIEHSNGDIVFVADHVGQIRLSELDQLWALRNDSNVLMAQADALESQPEESLMMRLTAWGDALRKSAESHHGQGGIQMIRREMLAAHLDSEDATLKLQRVEGDLALRASASKKAPSFVAHLSNLSGK